MIHRAADGCKPLLGCELRCRRNVCHIRHIAMARPADVPLVWLFGELKTPPFSAEARVEAGFLLRRLQQARRWGYPSHAPCPQSVPGAMSYGYPTGRSHQDEDQTMKQTKKARLEAAGWRVSDAAEFLGLSDEERRFVELKLALASGVRQLRERRGLTQAALAKQLRSSQSRVAKMEAADTSVSLDLMMRSLLSIGATPRDIAKLIRKAEAA